MSAANEHLRCPRCRKIPRGKMALAQRDRYAPHCSYHCSQWADIDSMRAYLRTLPSPTKGGAA